ncbi:MAG: hypothetical protein AB1490_13840 [Pseudomonadota bacterium]
MKTFIKPIALLGLAGALTVGALASQAVARDATANTSANSSNYYLNGAYAYETAPASVAAPTYQRGSEAFAYAPRAFGAPVRADDSITAQQRHLNGTE